MTEAIMKQISIFLAVFTVLASGTDGDEHCQLGGYNLEPLTKYQWAIPIANSQCQNKSSPCVLIFALCQEATLCPNKSLACYAQNGQFSALGGKANISERTNFNGFQLHYANYANGTEISKTTIEFVCEADRKLMVDPTNVYLGQINAYTTDQVGEGYNIVVNSEIGCKIKQGMGAGSTLMIILLLLFLLYFCGGIIYNHVNGARGEELIPHHWFWKNLPAYVVDGCIFAVRLVTCQTRENYSQNPDYGSTSPAGVSPSGRTYETL